MTNLTQILSLIIEYPKIKKEKIMKKLILLLSLSLLLVSFVFAESFEISKMLTSPKTKVNRTEGTYMMETFENDLTWTHYDGAIPAHMWHLQNNNPLVYGGTGYSWYMGKMDLGTNGGYMDNQYLVLDTPAITVTQANSSLSFKVNWKVEAPGGETGGYNGWDGSNVRISVNNGPWTVIEGLPAYNGNALYSFGQIHGEGLGVKGWVGNSNGWQNATFNLNQYIGQSVRIRFAFASDGGYGTAEDASLFGLLVDEISLGDFTYNFNDNNEHGMVYSSMVPQGGDLWHIEEYAGATSPSHVLVCQNDQNTYNTNMLNYIETGLITLPSSSEVRADFMIRGSFTDPNAFPEVDYFGWQISIDGGSTWRAMSNPYADPNGSNYVYSDAPEEFVSFVEAYSTDGYISNFAGQQVKFRWFFRSDADAPNGEGIMIDDFAIYYNMFAPVPTNLTAVKAGQNINLNWSVPGSGGQTGWISLCNLDFTASNGVGLSSGTFPATFDCAFKVPAETMVAYAGGQITKIKFFPLLNVPFTVKVWTGGSGATLAGSQDVATVVPEQWNEVVLTTPVDVQLGLDYWIGYTVTQQVVSTYPAAMDDIEHVANGDMANLGSGWQSIFTASSGAIDGNWLIQGLVEAGGREVVLDNREVEGFKVYHKTAATAEYELLATTADNASSYTHTAPAVNTVHYYTVSTLWDGIESAYSNEAMEFMNASGTAEFIYDDGVAEAGYAQTGFISTKLSPATDNPTTAKINCIKFYIHTKTSSNMTLKVWQANGEGGLPNTEIYSQTITPAMVNVGWNFIIIPAAVQPVVGNADFYIGFQESAGSSKVGLDQNTTGRSYKRTTTGTWALNDNGNFMIRAFVEGSSPTDPTPLVSQKLTAKNYPNPFNPETVISFNMPENGFVSLKVYNAKGQLVKTLLNSNLEKGQKSIVWNGTDNNNNQTSSGIYFYKVETAGQSVMNKMVLVK